MRELATRHYIDLTDEGAKDFTTIIDDVLESYQHLDGRIMWNGIANEGTAATIGAEGIGHFGEGYYATQLMDASERARQTQVDVYLATVTLTLILGEYLSEEYRSTTPHPAT